MLTRENDGGRNPRLNRFVAGELPRAELVILPQRRHAILLGAPHVVALPVLYFLRRHRESIG